MKKTIALLITSLMLFITLTACGGVSTGGGKNVKLTISTIDGSAHYFPFWVAQKQGKFKEVGVEIEYVGFDGGPVQMEAYDSWDLGTTGIGGVISATVGHDGVVLGLCNTDGATQNFFSSPNSDIVAAGQGNNTISSKVYGDAKSWSETEILSGYGDVKHFVLLKAMEGFGLTIDDLNVLWMDPSACLTSYFSGQGDAVAVYGAKTYDDAVMKETRVINANDLGVGLYTYMVANDKSLKDSAKAQAIKEAVKIYYEAADWIQNNPDDALSYFEDYYKYLGLEYVEEKAKRTMTHEYRFTIDDHIKDMFQPSDEDPGMNKLQAATAEIIKFYESVDVYEPGTADVFMQEKHFDFDIIASIGEGR